MDKQNEMETMCRTITVEECAEYLGIGRSACYALARQAETNGVPFYTFRIGGRLLISKKSFLDFMDANHL